MDAGGLSSQGVYFGETGEDWIGRFSEDLSCRREGVCIRSTTCMQQLPSWIPVMTAMKVETPGEVDW